MPASSTLELIPEFLLVQDLESYFRGRIRSANTVMNESRIVAGIRSVLAVNEEASLRLGDDVPGGNKGRNRHVLITEDRVCGVCYKRFGGSVVKVLPKYAFPTTVFLKEIANGRTTVTLWSTMVALVCESVRDNLGIPS